MGGWYDVGMWSALALAASMGIVGPIATDDPPAVPGIVIVHAPEEPTAKECREWFARTMAAVTLRRDRLEAALRATDPEVARAAIDAAFHDYAERVGPLEQSFVALAFVTEPTGAIRHATASPGEVASAAERLANALQEATEELAKDLSVAGVEKGLSADDVAARVYLPIASMTFADAFNARGSSPPDAARIFEATCAESPIVREARVKASADSAALDAYRAAERAYFAEVKRLATAAIARMAWAARSAGTPGAMTERSAKADERRNEDRRSNARWRDANDRLADAVTAFVTVGGGEIAAATWKSRYLDETASAIVPRGDLPTMMVARAETLGVSDAEKKSMHQILDETRAARLARREAVIRAYRQWERDAEAEGRPRALTDPPAALIDADDRRMAFDESLRTRLLACVQSALVRDSVAELQSGSDGEVLWRAFAEARRAAAAAAASNAVPDSIDPVEEDKE